MRVALAADHAGFPLKEALKRLLDELGVTYRDFGTSSAEPVDYPDLGAAAARAVASGECDRAILVCGTGIGMAMTANKIAGIRAAPAWTVETAAICREHNDANVLALGARTTPLDLARAIVRAFLQTPFAAGRHATRVAKIARLEIAGPHSVASEGDHS